MTNDLLPGKRYGGPVDEFQAFDALPRAVRRALDVALFPWSAADCLERLSRGETVRGSSMSVAPRAAGRALAPRGRPQSPAPAA